MRPTRAIVRLDHVVHNLRVAARLAPGSKNVPVIKANAYGHGAVEVARALAPHAPVLAVAFIDEAMALREAGIDIARRTVAKYREAMRIPSSVQRRREKQAAAS